LGSFVVSRFENIFKSRFCISANGARIIAAKGSFAKVGVTQKLSITAAALARTVSVRFGAGNQVVIVILNKNDA
jgi:hypothetical protein